MGMDVMRRSFEREAAGKDALHLEVGQPATAAPQIVRDAAKHAIDTNKIGYTAALGLPELRAKLAAHYGKSYNVDVSPNQIVITTGSSPGFSLAFLAAFDVGDRVALAAPGYPAYKNILHALGLDAVMIETGPETRFQPTVEVLEQYFASGGDALDGLIVASPANPTGTMLDEGSLRALAEYCQERGIRLISDEIYHGISYSMKCHSALEFSRSPIVVNSFSKYFSMTGWRLGWMVVPEDLVRQVECLAQNLYISAPTVSQIAGVAAFDCCEELDGLVSGYASRRSLLLETLPQAGFICPAPADGAFYVYADASRLTNDSAAFCTRMLDEIGVAATPGLDFDPGRGHKFVRFSFAGQQQEIAEAGKRMIQWLS